MKKIIATDQAPGAIGPYSQAVESEGLLFISGQLPMDAKTGKFAGNTSAEQARQSLKNVGAILEAAGMTYANVIKCEVFVKNMDDFGAINEVYAEFFQEPYPARAVVEVARLPKDALVEIAAIARK